MAARALADLYVRHAMPLRDPDRPPAEWQLGPAGRAAARELATRVTVDGQVSVVVSSTEPKALATAEPLAERFGVEVTPDERLVEAARPWVGTPNDYRALARRYLVEDEPEGWEARRAVVERMSAAVRAARAGAGDGLVAVVGHGLSLCVHLASQLPSGFDPGGLWVRLAFPDAWTVDREQMLLSRARR